MREKDALYMNGYLGVVIIAILLAGTIFSALNEQWFIGVICLIIAALLGTGITLVQPNQSIVVMFFGKYIGSIRREGLILTVPLTIRKTISLRVRNFNSNRLKVNDINGNPIEIAAYIVFIFVDLTYAVFILYCYDLFIDFL